MACGFVKLKQKGPYKHVEMQIKRIPDWGLLE